MVDWQGVHAMQERQKLLALSFRHAPAQRPTARRTKRLGSIDASMDPKYCCPRFPKGGCWGSSPRRLKSGRTCCNLWSHKRKTCRKGLGTSLEKRE